MMLLGIGIHANAADSWDALMKLPPFERAVLIIKHYETLHRPEHWPTVAYGHVVKKGERYLKRQYSHAEADLILRKDLAGLCARYRACGRDSLLLSES